MNKEDAAEMAENSEMTVNELETLVIASRFKRTYSNICQGIRLSEACDGYLSRLAKLPADSVPGNTALTRLIFRDCIDDAAATKEK